MAHSSFQPNRKALTIGGATLVAAGLMGAAVAIVEPTFDVPSLGPLVALALISSAVVLRYPLASEVRVLERAGAFLVAAATATVTFNALRPLPGMTLSDLFLVSGALLLAPPLIESGARGQVPRWLRLSVILLSVAVVGSSLIQEEPVENLTAGLQFVIALGATSLVFAVAVAGRIDLRGILGLWILSAAINGLLASADAFGLSPLGRDIAGGYAVRAAGLTLHPNHLAAVCSMALPVAFAQASTARGAAATVLYLGATAAVSLGVLVSGSRAALVASGIALISLVLFLPYRRLRVTAALFALAAVLVLIPAAASTSALLIGINRLTDPGTTAASDSAREQSFAEAIADFAASPLLGTGFVSVRAAHDIYLQLLQAGGLLALLGFAVFALGTLRLGIVLASAPNFSPQMKSLALAATLAVVVWLLTGMVQNQIYDRYLYVPSGLLIGLSWAQRRYAGH